MLCGEANGMRQRTKHNLGDDWGVSLKDMKVFNSFAHPELCSTLQLYKKKMTSFGEYFDNQHAAIVKAMQDKNKQLNVEWMERYEKRQKEKNMGSRQSERVGRGCKPRGIVPE